VTIRNRLLAEFLGTAGLLLVVVGSGIMGENLSQGNAAISLLANSIATGAGLYALIQTFAFISGAHFNPSVSLLEWLWKRLTLRDLLKYMAAQFAGGVTGVVLAHAMFGQTLFQISQHDRSDVRFLVSEVIATFGFLLVVALSGKRNVEVMPAAVALYITGAYWFTSSTSFANPAVTIARSLTNTFSGILWIGVPGFIIAQFLGTILAFYASNFLLKR